MLLMSHRRCGKGYPDSNSHVLMRNMNITRDRENQPLTSRARWSVSCAIKWPLDFQGNLVKREQGNQTNRLLVFAPATYLLNQIENNIKPSEESFRKRDLRRTVRIVQALLLKNDLCRCIQRKVIMLVTTL